MIYFRVLSFNCKNIKTCGPFFYDVLKNVDIVMLQEHWLFKCQLAWLEEIHADFTGCGKSVDNTDPLLPSHLPRGYGGVCILWRKTIDHLVTSLEIGNNRIQAIELQNKHGKNSIIITV